MRGYLLDTSVLSAFAPDRPAPSPAFQAWLSAAGRRQAWYIPVIAAADVQKGVAKLRRAGGVERANRLEGWLQGLLTEFGERVVPVDIAIARRAGDIEDAAIAQGRHPGLPDILITATALQNDLCILTSNTRHFDALGAANLNPLA